MEGTPLVRAPQMGCTSPSPPPPPPAFCSLIMGLKPGLSEPLPLSSIYETQTTPDPTQSPAQTWSGGKHTWSSTHAGEPSQGLFSPQRRVQWGQWDLPPYDDKARNQTLGT